jgi:hypothetical protein
MHERARCVTIDDAPQQAIGARGATHNVKYNIGCCGSFIPAAVAAGNPERFTQGCFVSNHAAARQARLVTKRTENRTVVNAAPARGDAFCELNEGCTMTFLVENTKAMSAAVKEADEICHRGEGRQDFKVEEGARVGSGARGVRFTEVYVKLGCVLAHQSIEAQSRVRPFSSCLPATISRCWSGWILALTVSTVSPFSVPSVKVQPVIVLANFCMPSVLKTSRGVGNLRRYAAVHFRSERAV